MDIEFLRKECSEFIEQYQNREDANLTLLETAFFEGCCATFKFVRENFINYKN